MALSNWMASFQDVKLGELHLPGSHDAGTSVRDVELTAMGTVMNSVTQFKTIPEQLEIGTRFFDLRLAPGLGVNKHKIVAHHTTAGQGAYGATGVDTVVAQCADWWYKNKTEVAIFRISHTSGSIGVADILTASAGDALNVSKGNLCDQTIRELLEFHNGGLIFIFDTKKFGNQIDQSKGVHAYSKCKSATGLSNGIGTCGCYKGTHALESVISNGLEGRDDHISKHGGTHLHLCQLYWQKTYSNPLTSRGIFGGARKSLSVDKKDDVHGGTHGALDCMLARMQGLSKGQIANNILRASAGLGPVLSKSGVSTVVNSGTLDWRKKCIPQIISYDFVNSITNRQIIDLNNDGVQFFTGVKNS